MHDNLIVCSACGDMWGLPHHCVCIPWDDETQDEPVPVGVLIGHFDPTLLFINLIDGRVYDVTNNTIISAREGEK